MGFDILGLGEVVVDWVAIVDHFPEPDEKIDSKSQSLFSGGVTANYAVAAARLGAKTGFIGAVGRDSHGAFLRADFEKENVQTPYLIEKDAPTPVNFIFVVESSGEKVIIQSPYMHTTVPSVVDISPNAFNDVSVLHTTGIYPEVTLHAFQIAKKNGTKISFDLEKQIVTRGKEPILEMLKYVDLLLPNKAGAMQLTKTETPRLAAQSFLDWGIKTVVITLGAEGSLAVTKDEEVVVPAIKTSVVDTTGAGDTFCAAFDYSFLLKKFSLTESLQIANAAASLKIQKLGARTGMPSLSELKSYLSQMNFKIANSL
jgi:ribokinase